VGINKAAELTKKLREAGFPTPEYGEQLDSSYQKIIDYIDYLEDLVQSGGL
jgi:hypothetical protein